MIPIHNPATGELIESCATDTPVQIKEKFQQAKDAQPLWAQTSLETRLNCIKRFKELVEAEKKQLAELLTKEVGKPLAQSKNELTGLSDRIDFFLEHTAGVLAEKTVYTDPKLALTEKITKEPLGVIANISAWNYPYFVGSNVFVPALLTGNAVLYKPSEFALLTGLAITRLLHTAGIPQNVFSVVIGDGKVGAELLKYPVNGVFFTGSYATGRKIYAEAALQMAKVQLELGGKDPSYVCEDVDITQTALALADGAFYNNGQSCCSVERIYVHESIYDAFVEAFVRSVKSFVIGDPMNEQTYIGPLTRGAQIGVLEQQIADALKKGARLECGGKKMDRVGNYFEPTVLTNVSHQMTCMKEESFGPIIGIQKVKNDGEALGLMNDTEYGLTAGVYTRDSKRAHKLMKELDAGSVYWNICDRVSPRLPWAGRGHSGIGCTLSTYGIETFIQTKAWHLKA